MIAQRHLENAPIKEAIIDIQINRSSNFNIKELEPLYLEFKDRYPNFDVLNESVLGLGRGQNNLVTTSVGHKQIGYKYTSEDEKNIVQFRDNGFTFSRLDPYREWEDMSAESRALWDIYKKSCGSCSIKRIATRFINILRIPLPITDFSEYLTAPPIVPEELPQGISSYLSRIVIQNPEIDATAIVTQALDSAEQGHAPITFDIDVFKTCEYSTDEEIHWEILDKLRTFKNQIFFESITEKMVGLF